MRKSSNVRSDGWRRRKQHAQNIAGRVRAAAKRASRRFMDFVQQKVGADTTRIAVNSDFVSHDPIYREYLQIRDMYRGVHSKRKMREMARSAVRSRA